MSHTSSAALAITLLFTSGACRSPAEPPAPVPEVPAALQRIDLPASVSFPEGIAYDAEAGVLYTGGAADGAIARGHAESGRVEIVAAAGAVEFFSMVMSVHTGIIPPTINYEEPDPECPLDYISGGAEHLDLEAAISNSFGFGGGNACLAAKKYRDEK